MAVLFWMTVSPLIVRGKDDQLFRGTTKRTKRERPPRQRERFKRSSETSLSGKKIKCSENFKLSSTEGIDSGRRCGSVVLSPKDVALNWLCVPWQVVPPCYMSFFLQNSRITLDLHVARPCVEEGCHTDYNRLQQCLLRALSLEGDPACSRFSVKNICCPM